MEILTEPSLGYVHDESPKHDDRGKAVGLVPVGGFIRSGVVSAEEGAVYAILVDARYKAEEDDAGHAEPKGDAFAAT